MKNQSVWNYETKKYPHLSSNLNVDIVVIGGGLAGITAAYFAAKSGLKVCVLEANRIGMGETVNSSAMVTFAHDIIYSRLIKKHGFDLAARYLQHQQEGLAKLQKIIEEEDIECELKKLSMILFSTSLSGSIKIKNEFNALQKLGVGCDYITTSELPYKIRNGIEIKNQVCINPLKYVRGLANSVLKLGGSIFESTRVIDEPKDGILKIGNFTVTAKNFIVATHFPYINIPGLYFLKMFQHRSHNIVFNSSYPLQNMYEGAENQSFEYRPIEKGMLLCGGANVRTGDYKHNSQYKIIEKHVFEAFNDSQNTEPFFDDGKKQAISTTKDAATKIIDNLPNPKNNNDKSHFKDSPYGKADIMYKFSAQDCMTFDMLPYVGKYSESKENVYVITGFNKWGFTNSIAAATILEKLIFKNKENLETREKIKENNIVDSLPENIFDTSRHYFIKAPIEAAKNTGEIVVNFANVVISADSKKLSRIQNGQGAVVNFSGKRVGIYKDQIGNIHAISAICPHLGCNLKWNKDDLSWDCPCHGSRFDIDGEILSNPTIEKAKKLDLS